MKKVLWLEDQYEDLSDYSSRLARIDYLVDPVKSVSEVMEKLENEGYAAYIFDLKVLPGNTSKWQELDERKRKKNPNFDPHLGFELLRFLDGERKKQSKLWEKVKFDFSKAIIFSVVNDKKVYDELVSFGIPSNQIVYKSSSDLGTLPELIKEMELPAGEEK